MINNAGRNKFPVIKISKKKLCEKINVVTFYINSIERSR